MINPYALSAVITSVTSLWLVFFVGISRKASYLSSRFFIFTLGVAAWSLAYSRMVLASNEVSGLFWARALHIGAIFIPVSFLHFAMVLNSDYMGTGRKLIIRIGYGLSLFFLAACFTDFFVPKTAAVSGISFYPQPGPLYIPYVVFFFTYVGYGLWLLAMAYKRASGLRKTQLRYIVIAYTIGYTGGAQAFLPVFGFNMFPYSFYACPLCMIIVALGISIHGLFDIELAVRNWIVDTLSSLAPGFVLTIFAWHWLPSEYRIPIAGLVLASCWLTPKVYPSMRGMLLGTVRGKKYGYLEEFQRLGQEIPQVENLREFLPLLAQRIVEKAEVQSCRVIVVEGLTRRPRFQAAFTASNGSRAASTDEWWSERIVPPLLERVERYSGVLLQEDLVKEGIVPLIVSEEEVEAIVPLRQEEHTFGMIVVGPKMRRGAMINQEDVKALSGIAEGVSKALWANLAHYEQVLKTEQALHDAINFYRNVELNLRLGQGHAPQTTGTLEMGMDLLRDLRFSNLVTLQRQRGEGMNMTPQDLARLIPTLAQGLVARAEAKGLKLSWETSAPLPAVRGNPQALTRVFENLVNNAIKYTKQGEVRVRVVGGAGGGVRVEVSDTGPGIASEHLPHLFEPFYRVQEQSLEEGTGLGLSVVKELVELHGGRVWVESQVGGGSRFVVELPGLPGGVRDGQAHSDR